MFDGWQTLMEDNLQWKITFNERWPLMEVIFQLKTTFDERLPSIENNLQLKMTFDGGHTLMEDGLWWKTTFDGRQPLIEDQVLWTFKNNTKRRHSNNGWTEYINWNFYFQPGLLKCSNTDHQILNIFQIVHLAQFSWGVRYRMLLPAVIVSENRKFISSEELT